MILSRCPRCRSCRPRSRAPISSYRKTRSIPDSSEWFRSSEGIVGSPRAKSFDSHLHLALAERSRMLLQQRPLTICTVRARDMTPRPSLSSCLEPGTLRSTSKDSCTSSIQRGTKRDPYDYLASALSIPKTSLQPPTLNVYETSCCFL